MLPTSEKLCSRSLLSMIGLCTFFTSHQAIAKDSEASLMWASMGSQIQENTSPITFASALGISLEYANRFAANLRFSGGYNAFLNSSSLVLHGPYATMKYTLLGGRTRRISDSMQTYTIERPFEFYIPVGASIQFYDLRSVVQFDGLRKKDALKLEGSAYSVLTGFEIAVPFQTDYSFRFGLNFSLGRLSETQGSFRQFQTNFGFERVL